MEQNAVSASPTVAAQALDTVKSRRSALIAAIFLMATSAIGPGFITQTATFTTKLGAAFAFGILASILIDFVVQLNIWRVVTLTRMRASDVANAAIPGSGYLLAVLVIVGGLFFNIGNIGGTGLGLNAVFGLDPKIGGAISAVFSIGIFLSKRAGLAVDRFIVFAGILMIVLTLYVAFVSGPPVGDALFQTFLPDTIDFATITTIVGGTVGGYITYSGAHRLLDRGMVGREHLPAVSGIVALSYLFGLAVPIAPAGLGAREGLAALLLSTMMPPPAAAVTSVLYRIISIAAELLAAGLAMLLTRSRT